MKPCWLVCLLALFAASGRADSIAINSDADTTISLGSLPTSPTDSQFIVGEIGTGAIGRALLHFDLSSIPKDATIDDVSVTVTVVKVPPGAGSLFELHRVTQPWVEATATWTAASDAQLWTNAGGDFAATASGAIMISTGGPYTFTGSGLLSDVQSWFSGSAVNTGWLLKTVAESSPRGARRFAAHEWGEPSVEPTLTVTYHGSAPPPPTLTLQNVRISGDSIQFDFAADELHSYTVEFLDAIGGVWQELSFFQVSSPTTITASDTIGLTQRFYRVRSDTLF